MKLFIKLDSNANIIEHDWNKENDGNFIPCKYNDPIQIFDIEKHCYKYKVVNGEYIELDEQGMKDHPLKRKEKRLKKLNRLKRKEEKKRHKQEWNEVKKSLTDQEELNEVDKILTDLDME